MVPGNKSPFLKPVVVGHIPWSETGVLERVVGVQGFLPQPIHHLVRHRHTPGREIMAEGKGSSRFRAFCFEQLIIPQPLMRWMEGRELL